MISCKHGILSISLMLSIALLGCKTIAVQREQLATSVGHAGQEWLAWPSRVRVLFVAAYIDGYQEGVHNACDSTDRLLDLKANKPYDHAKDEIVFPSGVCQKGAAHYTRFKPNAGDPDVTAYTEVLTRFYAEHAEYQDIPYEYLMQYLSDEQNKTVDDLSRMAKAGDIRTRWR